MSTNIEFIVIIKGTSCNFYVTERINKKNEHKTQEHITLKTAFKQKLRANT